MILGVFILAGLGVAFLVWACLTVASDADDALGYDDRSDWENDL